jgi:sulfate-transporting ATPase
MSINRAMPVPDKTVWQEISDGLDVIAIGSYQINSRAYVGRFNFKGPDQQKFVKDLSGGERNRVISPSC